MMLADSKRRHWSLSHRGFDGLVLVGFLGLTLLLRLGTFHRTVIDWDESLYLLLGRSLLRGEIPYTTLFEHSPVGGFALFALIQALFGQTVLAIRLASWLAVAAESVLLCRLGCILWPRSAAVGLIAGALYAVFTLNNLGLAAHRELFLAPLVTFAVYLLLTIKGPLYGGRVFLAGLAMGCALQIKYMYVFECAAVLLIAMGVVLSRSRGSLRERTFALLKTYIVLGIGPTLLVILPAAYFAVIGHWAEFANANFRSAVAYAGSGPYTLAYLAQRLIWQARSNALIWLGAILSPFYLILARDNDGATRRNLLYFLGWFQMAVVGTSSTGRYWDHYYLQLVAPGSLLTAMLVVGVLAGVAGDRVRYALGLVLLLIPPLWWIGYPPLLDSAAMLRSYYLRGVGPPADGPRIVADNLRSRVRPPADGPRIVADNLRSRVRPDDAIFVIDYEPIIYYLVDARIPTAYAFGSHLTNADYSAEGIDQPGEVRKAMDRQPAYVVMRSPRGDDFTNEQVSAELADRLTRDYTLETVLTVKDTFTNQEIAVQLYHLKARL